MSDVYRHAFGFSNPNHAAAPICALAPFFSGWRRYTWLGRFAFVALCVMLALTQSRTGLVLMAAEAIAISKCKVESVKCKMAVVKIALLSVAIAGWWMWRRLTIDDSILNRPRISASRTAFGWGICPAMPAAVAVAAIAVCAALLVPKGGAPMVRDGYIFHGEAPRTLALYDDGWHLRTVLPRVSGAAVLPVHAVSRFPHCIDLSSIGKVMLFGNCREWAYLVKGVPVVCAED